MEHAPMTRKGSQVQVLHGPRRKALQSLMIGMSISANALRNVSNAGIL
jgi:hypothetical protein